MSKKLSLPLVVATSTVVILLGAVVFMSSSLSGLETDLKTTKKDLTVKAKEVIELTEENEKLEQQIAMLQDSITYLNEELEVMEITIAEHETTIKELQGRIKRRESKIETLKEKIAKLAQQGDVNWSKIKELEDQKLKLKDQLDGYLATKETAKIKIENTVKKKEKAEEKMDAMTMIRSIVSNTSVKFRKVALRKQQHSGELDKIKKKDKNWKFTDIEFFLEHPNQKMLVGKTFRVKIKDLDNKRTLPINEDNKKYPESKIGKEGQKFVYDGNMVEILYFNSQKKVSQNYQIQVFLVEGDKAYVLKNGKQTIVEAGRVLPIGE